MPLELECWGGPLDGERVHLRPGQYELYIPVVLPAGSLVGPRRFAIYRVGRKGLQFREAGGTRLTRTMQLLLYCGEEWRIG
jgi:hypothetical protein